MSTTKAKAQAMIREAQDRFPFLDLETIQAVVIFRLEGEMIKGDEINEFYYESVKNWVYEYNG